MKQFSHPQDASRWCERQRRQRRRIGYVATMGGLHAGHLSLLHTARQQNEVVCASIFVNPLQFNHPADLAGYPGVYQQDVTQLERHGCDMVYTGTLASFFPEVRHPDKIVTCCPSAAASGLEGEFRPGYLPGVWAIVARLLRTVGSCTAYFGEKDFQQTLVIGDLIEQLGQPAADRRMQAIDVTMSVCPTVRAANGLALSSRNRHLAPQQLQRAAGIYQTLLAAERCWQAGVRSAAMIEQAMRDFIADRPGLTMEYAAVRDPGRWTEKTPSHALRQARALIACYVDQVRLIDNLPLS